MPEKIQRPPPWKLIEYLCDKLGIPKGRFYAWKARGVPAQYHNQLVEEAERISLTHEQLEWRPERDEDA